MGQNSMSSTARTELVNKKLVPAPNAHEEMQAKLQQCQFALAPLSSAGVVTRSRGRHLNTKMCNASDSSIAPAPGAKICRSDLDKAKYLTVHLDDANMLPVSTYQPYLLPENNEAVPKYAEIPAAHRKHIAYLEGYGPEVARLQNNDPNGFIRQAGSIQQTIETTTIQANVDHKRREMMNNVLNAINWVSTLTTVAHSLTLDKKLEGIMSVANVAATQ